jgi:hypothetical protein
MLDRLAEAAPLGEAIRDPILEIADRIGAHAEFHEMQRHGLICRRPSQAASPEPVLIGTINRRFGRFQSEA